MIVANLSNDPIYAEVLHKTFGPRVIGLQITRHGDDGMNAERRQVPGGGAILVFTIGRSPLLIEQFHTLLHSRQVRAPLDKEMMRRAFARLEALEPKLIWQSRPN